MAVHLLAPGLVGFQRADVGGRVPREYIPSVDAGIQDAMQFGVLAGYPMVGVKATLLDGAYHDVDSSEMAFKIAGSQAFKEGVRKANPIILEPLMAVEVRTPTELRARVEVVKRRDAFDRDPEGFTAAWAPAEAALRDRYAGQGGFSAVSVRLRFNNGQTYGPVGRLDYADPTVATTTDTLTLRAVMPNPLRPGLRSGDPGARELIDGQFVTVVLEGVQPVQAVTVPRVAVLQDQQGAYVWVVGAENKAEQRRIQLGQSTPETAVISTGLQEGETVVVDGLQRVRPGAAVNPGPIAPRPTAGSQGPRT